MPTHGFHACFVSAHDVKQHEILLHVVVSPFELKNTNDGVQKADQRSGVNGRVD